ncbi:MAG: glycosyltransferase family 2 protein [Oscillospiraceae bacterium]
MEQTLLTVNFALSLLFLFCYFYQFAYLPVPILKKMPPHEAPRLHRYAVLICARNEEAVISDLLACLRRQTYDPSLVTVFVMADNCTDRTAEIAREGGAVVYERFNQLCVGKGYALDALLQHIQADYPRGFDGYFVFDADNVLENDYIEQMNRTFSDGYEIVTSYRNSKNYGENWISAGYALWFLRESRYLNQARMLLGTSCAVSGTGFLFSRRILEKTGGWRFYLLTEDIEFTVHHVLEGETIGFCPDAVLYDEQPADFRLSCRQRLRWARGYLQVFRKYGARLIGGALRGRFSCYDMSMAIMPAIALTTLSVLANLLLTALGILNGEGALYALASIGQCAANMYLTLFIVGAVTTATEWKQIHTTTAKKLLYTLTFPLFMFTYVPISFAAFFTKVEWKPIRHRVSMAVLPTERG